MASHNQSGMAVIDHAFDRAGAAVAQRYERFAYEGFILGENPFATKLLDPLDAKNLRDALAEVTARWSWSRGQRLGLRQIGEGMDVLHVYAVRQKSQGGRVWRGHLPSTQHEHWLDKICEIDLNVLAGVARGTVGFETELHERRQRQRPEGARK